MSRAGSTQPSQLPDDARVRRAPGVVDRALGQERVIVHVKARRIFRLNGTAAAIWTSADDATVASIAEHIVACYRVDQATARADVESCVVALRDQGLLEVE